MKLLGLMRRLAFGDSELTASRNKSIEKEKADGQICGYEFWFRQAQVMRRAGLEYRRCRLAAGRENRIIESSPQSGGAGRQWRQPFLSASVPVVLANPAAVLAE